jgi:flagellar biogenesis protein FliO
MENKSAIILFVLLVLSQLVCDGVALADTLKDAVSQGQIVNTIPYRNSEMLSGDNMARLALAVAIGISFVILAIWAINKLQHKLPGEIGKNKLIRLIETRRITQKITLTVFEVGNKTYVLAQNGDNIVRVDAYDGRLSESGDE